MQAIFGSVIRMTLGLSLMVAAFATAAQAGGGFLTPEIDPGSIGSALTLVATGAFIISGKSRKS